MKWLSTASNLSQDQFHNLVTDLYDRLTETGFRP